MIGNIIAWIIIGLLAGAIAKLILPGRQGGGWIATLVLGLVGALLGGWIGSALGFAPNQQAFSWATLIWAIIGGVIVAFIWQWIQGRRGAGTRR
ncbi:transglycosylase [Tersicoccus solisilvae]|uniref:Transglycosylase n=1 Tax=Tersicoccus solisilvae TaxID=1882339 RepID=A0ABQ1PEB6_9MICC|nr:GlsB/YeaQ/YmgE family stress response membrane protein [Tersicoccus solisilvae]GGC95554.1 transglycosylase [Tersicoccus solisilvae]